MDDGLWIAGPAVLLVLALVLVKLHLATRGYDAWNTAMRAFMTVQQREQDDLEDWEARQF